MKTVPLAVLSTSINCVGRLLGAAALIFSLNAIATPIPTYKVIDLGFTGTALNNRGQVAGYSSEGAVLRDRNGTIRYLGSGQAVDVNEFGQVLGDDNGHAWIWDSVFGRRDFAFGGATALNDRGQFVGYVSADHPGIPADPFLESEGYFWDPIFGLTPTPDRAAHQALAPLDINNHATIVGHNGAGEGPAFVMENGVVTKLDVAEVLDLPPGFSRSLRATAINERGETLTDQSFDAVMHFAAFIEAR